MGIKKAAVAPGGIFRGGRFEMSDYGFIGLPAGTDKIVPAPRPPTHLTRSHTHLTRSPASLSRFAHPPRSPILLPRPTRPLGFHWRSKLIHWWSVNLLTSPRPLQLTEYCTPSAIACLQLRARVAGKRMGEGRREGGRSTYIHVYVKQ